MTTRAPQGTPTIARVEADSSLVELVFDPLLGRTALAYRRADGRVSVEASVETAQGDQLIPYAASNNLLTARCVLLPSDIGDVRDDRDLVAEVRTFIHRYADLTPGFEEIAAYYVLLTWVHDVFNDVPYLRVAGAYGSGKTRFLLTMGSLCYRPFFASGASTVSPIFHVLDVFGGTLMLDEADLRFSDATADLTKILNNGTTRGLPVLRTMTNRHNELNPRAFRVFGPKVVAMRESFSDRALESRFITEETGSRPLRADIPIHLPATFETEALAIRNRLLRWRFSSLSTVRPRPERLPPDLQPRLSQMALPLLSVMDDEEARDRLAARLRSEDARIHQERDEDAERIMAAALIEAFEEATTPHVALAHIASRYNVKTGAPLELSMSNKWVGWFIRSRLRIVTVKSNGVYVVPHTERPKVERLAERFALGATAGHDANSIPP